MNNKNITKKQFNEEYVEPFINSWENIKYEAVQYKCRQLVDIERGENPLKIEKNKPLYYFLVDDGEKGGGMFLAAAYEKFIEWQNQFIDDIIGKNNINGILNSYIFQFEKEIEVQEASEGDIIKIDNNIYGYLNYLISCCSIRNIFDINDKPIYYKNYNDLKYNYDMIEEELGKILLPGIKKFRNDKIKFITYIYEGFRGQNTGVLVNYNSKYEIEELTEEDKNYIKEVLKNTNNDKKIYNDIFSSLQILMNEILKENYPQKYLIFDIINKIPKYVILNEELIELIIKRYKKNKDDSFSVNSLVSIFEYFEEFCWEDIKKYIPEDFKEPLNKEEGKKINYYFEYNNNNKLIDKINLTQAIRKLISRYIVGTRQDTDIKADENLKLYIIKAEFWPKYIIEDDDKFNNEIAQILESNITISQSLSLYDFLKGDEAQIKKKLIIKEESKKIDKNISNFIFINKIDDNNSINNIIENDDINISDIKLEKEEDVIIDVKFNNNINSINTNIINPTINKSINKAQLKHRKLNDNINVSLNNIHNKKLKGSIIDEKFEKNQIDSKETLIELEVKEKINSDDRTKFENTTDGNDSKSDNGEEKSWCEKMREKCLIY